MTVIGVTGGIGSGKTTFCRFFEAQGIPVINADSLAKEIMVTDESVIKQVIAHFGIKSYNPDGSLNRHYLSDKAFNENKVQLLNSIVHPVVKGYVLDYLEKCHQNRQKIVIYEAAIMLNSGRPDFVDIVVWMEAPQQCRIKRVVERDNTSSSNVLAIIDKQLSIESVRDYIDIVIHNNGSLSELRNEADKLIQEYSK